MRREVLSADRAMIVDFQECAKQFALAAARAAAAQSALQRGPDVALGSRHRIRSPDLGGLAHGFHDLPFFDLPGPALPGLRSFLRGLRPGCAFACALMVSLAPGRLRPRGAELPS